MSSRGWPLLRPHPAQYVVSLLSIIVILAAFLAIGFNIRAILAGVIGGGVVVALQVARAGVELRPDALVQNFGLRSQSIPWPTILDLGTLSAGGGKVVEASLAGGRRLKLYLPRTGGLFGSDPGFDAKFALVQRSWLAGRGSAPWLEPGRG